MTARTSRIMEVFIIISAIMAATGCATPTRHADAARATVSDAVSGIAGVVAHTESAQRHVQQAVPHADSTGKVHLAAATDEHKEIIIDAAQAKQALTAAATQIDTLDRQITNAKNDYAKLEARWYVGWGRRIERALWIIGISWLVCGIASIALGMGNPLSLTWRMGKEITRIVPFMNPFSWVRDWILGARAGKGG